MSNIHKTQYFLLKCVNPFCSLLLNYYQYACELIGHLFFPELI